MFDMILTGGAVIDGSGAEPYAADVAVRDGRIVQVGFLTDAPARARHNVTGQLVAPGFIDVHNHADGWVLRTGCHAASVSQGVTTLVLMSDGISYAPLDREDAEDWITYLRPLDGLEMPDYRGWQSWDEFLSMAGEKSAQHLAALAPLGNLRVRACGWGRAGADDGQINCQRHGLAECLAAGAVGLSSGLDYIGQGFTTTEEIVRVLRPMSRTGRVYVTHVRYKEGTLAGVREALEIGRRACVPVHISHLKATSDAQRDALLEEIDRAVAAGDDVTFDIYPYMAGSSTLAALLPYEVWEAGPLAAMAKLAAPRLQRRLAEHLAAHGHDLEQIVLAWTAGDQHRSLWGLSLAECARRLNRAPAEAVIELLVEHRLAVLAVFHVGDDRAVEPFLLHPRAMLASDGIFTPAGPVHPRAFGSTTRLLGDWVRGRGRLTWATAIHKLSTLPARRFGLRDRGEICPGAWADLVVFDPGLVIDRATYHDPRQFSLGVRHVFTAGTEVWRDGQPLAAPNGDWPGRVVRFGE